MRLCTVSRFPPICLPYIKVNVEWMCFFDRTRSIDIDLNILLAVVIDMHMGGNLLTVRSLISVSYFLYF